MLSAANLVDDRTAEPKFTFPTSFGFDVGFNIALIHIKSSVELLGYTRFWVCETTEQRLFQKEDDGQCQCGVVVISDPRSTRRLVSDAAFETRPSC